MAKRGRKMVTITISHEAREALGILKKRMNTRTLTEALEAFLTEHDPDLAQSARAIVEIEKRAVRDTNQ